jgi:hypothetical protein
MAKVVEDLHDLGRRPLCLATVQMDSELILQMR